MIELLMAMSARQAAASALGVDLWMGRRMSCQHLDAADLGSAALSTVFGCGQTSIDLCASALLRWHGRQPLPDREFDFGELMAQARRQRALFAPQPPWIDEVKAHPELWDLRCAAIHRFVVGDVILEPGKPVLETIGASASRARTDATLALPAAAQFVEDRWRQFWSTF